MEELTRSLRLPPQSGQPPTVRAMMADVLVALLPTLGMAIFFFGPRALILTVLSVAACLFFEWGYRRLIHQEDTLRDLSACVTGLLLALSLPAGAPWWSPILGAFFAIVVVKQLYGGLGKNFMNPALAGRMLLAFFPVLMTGWGQPFGMSGVNAISAATPMTYLHSGILPPQSLDQLFLGYQGGCLGEVSSFALLMGGLYLFLRRVVARRIPLAFLGTVAVIALLFPQGGQGAIAWMLAQLLSGGLLLGVFFFATDPVTSPVTPRGQIMFGVGCGVLTMLLRYHSAYPEGVGWAILAMNCLVWLLDWIGMPRRFGIGTFDRIKHWGCQTKLSLSKIRFVKPELHLFQFLRTGKAPGEAHLDLIRAWGKTVAPLAAVVLVTGAAVLGVHLATDQYVTQAEAQAQQALLAQIMPRAAFSSETPYQADGALSIQAGYDADSQLLGYCVEVQVQGFSGPITLEVGVDLDGRITGVAVIDHRETPNVGAKATDSEALGRYVGRSGTLRSTGRNSVAAVAGATVTSDAITQGVNRALSIMAALDTTIDVDYVDSDG